MLNWNFFFQKTSGLEQRTRKTINWALGKTAKKGNKLYIICGRKQKKDRKIVVRIDKKVSGFKQKKTVYWVL